MLSIILLAVIALLYTVIYWKHSVEYVKKKWRFIKLMNALPGPSAMTILKEISKLSLDPEKFTYQTDVLLRKYAYEHDHGITSFWFGTQPVIFLTRAKSAKVVLENAKLVDKPEEYDILKRLSADGLLTSSGETWYKFRRILTPAFHFNILNKYIEGFNEQSKILMEKLEKHCGTGETFDILPMLRLFGLDVIAETAMGVSLNAQSGQNAEYSISLAKLFNLMWAKTYYPWFWFAAIRWLYGYDQKVENVCNVCKSITMKIFQKKKKEWEAFKNQPSAEDVSGSGKKRLPFLELLFSVRDEYNLSDEDIKCQVDMFMSTGSDTVTSQLGFNLFALGHRPEIQDKVYAELKEIFGEAERDVTMEDMNNMKYLYQCICETGRFTPNTVYFGRMISKEIGVCGYTFPAGATCAISPFTVMRDPQHYDNPDVYDPEHFSPENVAKRDPFAFIPFSAGIRNCLGRRFAILELKLTLAVILRKYRVISMVAEEENRPITEFNLKPSKGFPIRLERR